MKPNPPLSLPPHQGETIARFGTARLLRKTNGRHELVGGTPAARFASQDSAL